MDPIGELTGLVVVASRRELCLVRNVSAGGLLAHVYSALRPGQEVAVELKSHQQIAGRVGVMEAVG